MERQRRGETAGTTQNARSRLNILKGIFNPDRDLLFNFTTQGIPLLLETICIALPRHGRGAR